MKRLAGAQRRAHLHGQFYEAKEGRTVQEGLIEFLVLRTAAGGFRGGFRVKMWHSAWTALCRLNLVPDKFSQ